jgi:hypothetical protein
MTKAWIIDPETQSITEKESRPQEIGSLISEVVGEGAECCKLDLCGNAMWYSDTDTNDRFAYVVEGMGHPLCVLHYSKGLIISLGPAYLDKDTIRTWISWHDESGNTLG